RRFLKSSLGQRARSDAPMMASDFAVSVLTAERNKLAVAVAVSVPGTFRSCPCMRLLKTSLPSGQRRAPWLCLCNPLHRRDRLQRREPLADQGGRPGHGHEVVEGEPNKEYEHGGIGDDQRPALARLVAHEKDDKQAHRRN